MVQHHDRTVVERQSAEGTLELVAVEDGTDVVRRHGLVLWLSGVGQPAPGTTGLGVAGVHQEPVRPSLEARRVAQLRQLTPDVQQRLLGGVLSLVGIGQDVLGHPEKAVEHGVGQVRERALVAALCPKDVFDVHGPPVRAPMSWRLTGYDARTRPDGSMFVAAMTTVRSGPLAGAGWADDEGLGAREDCRGQYSPLITKNEPRMVPASFDFWRANLNREASSGGTSIPSQSLNPTARLPASSMVYSTLMDRPLS